MENYKVKQEDLIGQLEGFPIEVVQAMVDEQVRQGNKADVVVFQKNKVAGLISGGFAWSFSYLGYEFWSNLTKNGGYDWFFEIYPKQEQLQQQYESKYCNLYHNNATMQFKTGEHTYSDSESAYENRKENSADGYRYFTTIECSIKE